MTERQLRLYLLLAFALCVGALAALTLVPTEESGNQKSSQPAPLRK